MYKERYPKRDRASIPRPTRLARRTLTRFDERLEGLGYQPYGDLEPLRPRAPVVRGQRREDRPDTPILAPMALRVEGAAVIGSCPRCGVVVVATALEEVERRRGSPESGS